MPTGGDQQTSLGRPYTPHEAPGHQGRPLLTWSLVFPSRSRMWLATIRSVSSHSLGKFASCQEKQIWVLLLQKLDHKKKEDEVSYLFYKRYASQFWKQEWNTLENGGVREGAPRAVTRGNYSTQRKLPYKETEAQTPCSTMLYRVSTWERTKMKGAGMSMKRWQWLAVLTMSQAVC